MEQCRRLEYEDVGGYAKIDTNRFARTGFPEVVYAEGKTAEQVAQIMELMVRKGVDANVMATRVAPTSVEEILAKVAPVRCTLGASWKLVGEKEEMPTDLKTGCLFYCTLGPQVRLLPDGADLGLERRQQSKWHHR